MLLKKEDELTRDSYYESSVMRPPASAPLSTDISADVCVVGGGYAGLAAALELAERGRSVVLLEARRIGWGASGRNGGQVLVGFGYAGQSAIEKQLPAAEAHQAWDITVEGLHWLRQRIARHHIDCDLISGHLSVAVNTRKAKALEAWASQVTRNYDYPLQPIPPAEISTWIASSRFHSGVFDAQSGHLHPLKYCLGLAQAARDAGVQIFENSAAIHVIQGDPAKVQTSQGKVSCRFVVLAGNVYLDKFGNRFASELMPRIMPVGTYVIATSPMDRERADKLIRQRAAVFDNNLILDYFRVTADHRLLFGGGESYTTATPRNLAPRMRRRMLDVFPQLADLDIPHVWGGFVDITMNQAPDFGRLDGNIYYLQGFSGHGLVMAGMAGKLAAEAIAGQSERFDLFARIRHHAFPGGTLLRTPALVLGMLYHRLRDLF